MTVNQRTVYISLTRGMCSHAKVYILLTHCESSGSTEDDTLVARCPFKARFDFQSCLGVVALNHENAVSEPVSRVHIERACL